MSHLRLFTTDQASSLELAEVRGFLGGVFNGDFSDDDWEHACGGTHVLLCDADTVVAHASVVPRPLEVGHTMMMAGYVEAVGTLAARRHRGLGSSVMLEINRIIEGDYDLGALSTGSHAFYERLGWERWQGRTFVRDGDRQVHTPDDDDSVMVRRFGPSGGVDLTSRLVCESRPGDPW